MRKYQASLWIFPTTRQAPTSSYTSELGEPKITYTISTSNVTRIGGTLVLRPHPPLSLSISVELASFVVYCIQQFAYPRPPITPNYFVNRPIILVNEKHANSAFNPETIINLSEQQWSEYNKTE